jgi:hypothetical protein
MAASISSVSSVVTFTGDSGEYAIARSTVTTTASDELVTFEFEVTRNALVMRVGSTAGGQEIVSDIAFLPGNHVISFTPDVATYYVEFQLRSDGTATLEGFARVAAGVFEIESPYETTDLPSVRYDQSLNTVFLAGGGKEMHVLQRLGAYSFSLRPYKQFDGPFAALNLSTTTMTPDGNTGTVTITSSTPAFSTTDAGSLIRLTHPGQYETGTFTGVDQVTDAIRVTGVETSRQFQFAITGTFSGTVLLERSIGNEYSFETVASYTAVTGQIYDDDLDNQVIYYRMRMSAYTSGSAEVSLTYGQGVTDGIGRIVSVAADNEVTVDVIDAFGKTTATTLWQMGAWSDTRGHPSAVGLYDGRLWAARSNEYWGSYSDDFSSFAVGTLDADAISRTFGGRMSSARWLRGASRLVAGLAGFEAEIASGALDEVISPANVRSRAVQDRGVAASDPVLKGDGVAYISRSRERLYHILPSEYGGMQARDLTRLNRDIAGSGGFKQIDVQREPEPRIWAVRNDGQVGVCVYDEDEQVMAWCRMLVDGYVESVCCLPGTPEDEVYFVIKRTVDGGTVRYIEKLAPEAWDTVTEANRLHCSLTYNGASTTSLSGLDHLEGRDDVYVWGDGRLQGPFTVASGAITLNVAVEYAIIGLLYEGKYKSGRLNWGTESGSGLASFKQLEKLGMVLKDTAGGCLRWGDTFDTDEMSRLDDLQPEETLVFDGPVQLWNEDVTEPLESSTTRDTRLCVTMPGAGPATVLGLAPTLKTNNG